MQTRPSSGLHRLICVIALAAVCGGITSVRGQHAVRRPFVGVTHITRSATSPRHVTINVVAIDLSAPGIRVTLTPPRGRLETIRQTTLAFLEQEQAQVAVNGHFFLPFHSASAEASLIGLAASNGEVYSAFESPVQSYALVADAPAINIDAANRASIVHADPRAKDGKAVRENVTLWNAVAGSAQIVTNGVKTIPRYADAENSSGQLTPGGPGTYSNRHSWYSQINARTVIGLANGNRTLILLTVDRAKGSLGLSLDEVADLLIRDYAVENALNLDGGGSTTLAMEDPVTGVRSIVNASADNPSGRAVGSNLAVFAGRAPAQ